MSTDEDETKNSPCHALDVARRATFAFECYRASTMEPGPSMGMARMTSAQQWLRRRGDTVYVFPFALPRSGWHLCWATNIVYGTQYIARTKDERA